VCCIDLSRFYLAKFELCRCGDALILYPPLPLCLLNDHSMEMYDVARGFYSFIHILLEIVIKASGNM
jgi:hypothetical protein